jgi:hypothetical protein
MSGTRDAGIRASRGSPPVPAAGGQVATMSVERIRGRQVDVEIGEVSGVGWVAIGVVKQGLRHEEGMRFEAHAADAAEAQRRLQLEIEAALA